MTEFLELLKSGRFQGIAILAVVAFSGLGKYLLDRIESTATKIGIPWVLEAIYWFMLVVQGAVIVGLCAVILILMSKDTRDGRA